MSTSWWVYIIRTRENKLYTGVSTDVDRRFNEHSASGTKAAKALRGKGPLDLVFKQSLSGRSEALMVEAKIKKMQRQDKEALIAGRYCISGTELIAK